MSSIVPCMEYCSDEKSSQTSLLMELSPLSNNTQPSPKDSGVDVSSPSRRDEDNIFGSPQILQTLSSKGGFASHISSSQSGARVFESSDVMTAVALSSKMKISTNATGPSMCSLEVGSGKLEEKEYSKTSKFYSRDRKKHFNIGEFQAKEFRKIIMSDPKEKRKKCPSLTKSSTLPGVKCSTGQSNGPGTMSKKAPNDLNKNYAVIPIEKKKVGIVIKVTKPFSDTRKRKNSVDKVDSSPKKNIVSKDILANSKNNVDKVDRSSNMSPTMPELHKETPFVGGKFLDENRRATRSQLNLAQDVPCFQSDRRTNLRSGSKASPCGKAEDGEDASCPPPPVITAIEPQEESLNVSHMPKKITCKLAGNVIVKTLASDHHEESKSGSSSRKTGKSRKSSKESREYLQVKSISGLKIKLAKPGLQTSCTAPAEHSSAPKVSENLDMFDHRTLTTSAQGTGSFIPNNLASQNLCKIVSSHNSSSPIMSSFQVCSSVSSYCPKSTCAEGTSSLAAGERHSNGFKVLPGFNGFQLENFDGKVKFTQEKEVVMPDGKKKKLKLKMFVPSSISMPSLCEGDSSNFNIMDGLPRLNGSPADFATSVYSHDLVAGPEISSQGSYTGRSHCATSMVHNYFPVPEGCIDEKTFNLQASCSLPVDHWPSPRVVLSQCTSQNSNQFIEDKSSCFDPGNMINSSCSESHVSVIQMQKSHKSKSHHDMFPSTLENAPFCCDVVSGPHNDKIVQLGFDGASKCNSTPVCKSTMASGTTVSGTEKVLGIPHSQHAAMPTVDIKPDICSGGIFSSVCVSPAPRHLKECCDLTERMSSSSTVIKAGAEESNDYGDMPTLEKNDISDKVYLGNQLSDERLVNPVTEKFQLSKSCNVEKENLTERPTKKIFKFDGLELEYSVDNMQFEEGFSRCLRKRSKDEKEEKEKVEKQEKSKHKRKRGVSRTSAKKLKGYSSTHHLETASQDIQTNQSSHIQESASSAVLTNANVKTADVAFSSSMLNQSFDFSTPPPSDASCSLGELLASSLEDPRFASTSSSVCSRSFCVDEPACSGSVVSASFSLPAVSTPYSVMTSISAAFCISSSSPLPWHQILSASTKSSESLNPLCCSPCGRSRSLNLPVVSSHLSPLSSVCMTPMSAEIIFHGQNNAQGTPALGSPDSVTTSPSPPSPPPPPPKFVRSFKEVEPMSEVRAASSAVESVTSVVPSSSQSQLQMHSERLSSAPLDVPQRPSDATSLFAASSPQCSDAKATLLGSNERSANNHLFAPPLLALCNGRDKLALFEEKSMRLHRISQRLQANSAITLKNSSAQDAENNALHSVLGKSTAESHLQEHTETKVETEVKVEEAESVEKTLDKNLKDYFDNNEEAIAKYTADQVQLVKLRNKAYRLFCCLFPEVQMPLRLSPDSEAVDQLLESVVLMLEDKEKIKARECKTDFAASSEGSRVCSDAHPLGSLRDFKFDKELGPQVVLCCKPHSCLLQFQGLVRQFLCLVLPHLNAYLSSDASLSVMDKIIDRVVLANCAFIGLGCTNDSSPSAQTVEDDSRNSTSSKSEDFLVT